MAADCGDIGEEPCADTGCERGIEAGGLCVTSCGEPAWRCCDADADGARCLRPSLACVEVDGVDQTGVPFTMQCRECGGRGEPVCTEPTADEPCDDDLEAEDGICIRDH